MTAWLLSNLTSLLITAGGAILALIAAYAKGRLSGAKKEREKQSAQEAKARDVSDEIEDAIAGREPSKNRADLKRW